MRLLVLFALILAAPAAERPNLIVIMADDIGYECFGAYGSEQYRTPHLDRLAREGMRFDHCYSQPLCTPSRVKLMTGLSNVRNYSAFSILNPDQKTFAHHLGEAGYTSLVAGKWQLLGADHYPKRFRGRGSTPEQAGFDHHCLWQVDELGERYWGPQLTIDGESRRFGKDRYGPEVVTEHILRFIEEHREGPFLVYYPMILVHSPFPASPDSENPESRDKQRNFEDMVFTMDRLVGRIVARVDELGLSENTLILFTGDNGTHRSIRSRLGGREIRGGKGLSTDAGTRVPLVARWKGTIGAGRTTDDLVDFSDMMPTLLDAAGAPPAPETDGRSFLPQLRGEAGNPRDSIFIYSNPRPERTKPVRFARDQRYKLYGDGRFFDVTGDVLEKHPLRPPYQPGAAEARRRLAATLDRMPEEGVSLLELVPAEPER